MLVVSDLRIDPRVERAARALVGRGFRLTIIFPDLTPAPFSEKPVNWGPNVMFKPAPSGAASFQLTFPWLLSDELLALAVEEKAFAYHCHDLNTALVGLAASRRTGARLVCDFHEWFSENVSWNLRRKCYVPHPLLKRAVYKWAERLMLRQADAVITVNQSIARELEAMVGAPCGRVDVVRNIPPLAAKPTRAYPPLKAQLGVAQNRFVVLYQGGTGPTRLLEPVIEALSMAPKVTFVIRGPSLDLFGVGYRALAERVGVQDRLILADPVPSRDVVAAARGADAGLWTLPNLSRNFYLALPNKVFEYLAAGLPLLVANFPEATRIAKGVGLTFDPYDPNSIAAQMNRLAEDPTLAARCRAAVPGVLASLDATTEWNRLAGIYERFRPRGENCR